VKLESYATPQLETPQQRHASLHRAIECGLASDDIWKELADVCLRLGKGDESVRCMLQIADRGKRIALASRLARLGLIEAPPEVLSAFDHHCRPKADGASGEPKPKTEGDELWDYRLTDHVLDAFQYMAFQHMPWLVLITTLAFPGVIGVGGFLTAGGSWLLLAAMAALPGLCVLATVGAMGRQVLLTSAEGQDLQGLPGFHQLLADARRFLADVGVVLGTLIGPSVLALSLGVPFLVTLPGLVIGAFLAPMAWVLRQLRGDFGALSPTLLMRAISRTFGSYLGVAGITVALFVPAAVVTWAVLGRPLWVQIAIIGPLCVLPVFVASRLLGTWVDAQRHRLGTLLHCEPKVAANRPQPVAVKVVQKALVQAPAPRPVAPAPVQNRPAAVAKRPMGPTPPPAGTPRARTNERKAAPAPSPIRAKAKAPAAAPAPAAARPAAPAQPARPAAAPPKPLAQKPVAKAIEGRSPTRRSEAAVLANMPGAVVVSGSDRKRHGAAAKRP
jgi:hypothetical protein